MTGDIGDIAEGLADAGTGSAVAAAIERERNAADAGGHSTESACLNCGTPLVGSHCHACGQRGHVHKTIGAFFHDLLHGVLHFEGKTWRTLPLLAWKPGKLTREYIDGKRASYVSPIALFLFVVFLSFALFNALGGEATPAVEGVEEARVAYAENAEAIAALEATTARLEGAERAEKQAQLAKMKESQEKLGKIVGAISGDMQGEFAKGFDPGSLAKDSALAKGIEHVRENPQLAIYKAQTSAYKYSWMLIPLSVPFVWLLFPFSGRFGLYDHTVFVTYSITFMIALVAAVSLLFYAGLEGTGLLMLLYAPFHMYRQLRGTYGVGRFGAVWRVLALSLFAWAAIGLFAAAIFWMAGS